MQKAYTFNPNITCIGTTGVIILTAHVQRVHVLSLGCTDLGEIVCQFQANQQIAIGSDLTRPDPGMCLLLIRTVHVALSDTTRIFHVNKELNCIVTPVMLRITSRQRVGLFAVRIDMWLIVRDLLSVFNIDNKNMSSVHPLQKV